MRQNRISVEIIKKHKPVIYRFIFILLALIYQTTNAQTPETKIDFSIIHNYVTYKNPPVVFVNKKFDLTKNYSAISNSFKPLLGITISPEKVISKVITRITIVNTGEKEESCYFFPGFYFSNVNLYKVEKNNKLTNLPTIAPDIKDSVSFRLITIAPNDSMTLLAECIQIKTYVNLVRPRFIQKDLITAYISEIQLSKKGEALFTYVFCGLLIMMVLFSLANFLQGRNREYLYYAAYAFLMGFMFFTKQFYFLRSNFKNFFYEEYLDFILQGIGICFFMAFMMRFLETRSKYRFLYNLYLAGISFTILSLIVYSYLHFGTDNYYLEQLIENNITKVVLLLMIVIFLVYAVRKWHNQLFRYVFIGHLLFFMFAIASLIMVLFPGSLKLPGIFGSSLVLYEFGLLLELVFFLIALTYKNKKLLIEKVMESERLKLDNERKELEKQKAVLEAHQEERERISADMHDELGSGMTTIRLMSEIAKNKMKDKVPIEIEKISHSANDLLNKMNAIIWSMNSSNDTVDNLVSYIRAYATDFFDGTSINCKITTPSFIPDKEISGDKRRNFFLSFKETLNNSLKHSKATEIKIDISVDNNLLIKIADNGIGLVVENDKLFGNGIKNITRRMLIIGGNYSIANNEGAEITLELPI